MWPFDRNPFAPASQAVKAVDQEARKDDAPPRPRRIFIHHDRPVVELKNVMAAKVAIEHPVTQRALRYVSRAVQVVEWYAEPAPGVRGNQREVKAINNLLASPNNDMTPSMLRYWLALNAAVFGRAPFKVGVDGTGMATGIYPLDAEFVKHQLNSSTGRITGFTYGDDKNAIRFPTRELARPGSPYIYQISSMSLNADLGNVEGTLIPLRAVGGPSAVIRALLERTLSTAQGHPNSKYIIATTDDLDDEEKAGVDEYVEDRSTFGQQSGKTMFMQGNISVHKLDSDLSDAHSKAPLDDMTRIIIGAFGIPTSLWGLGAADGAKYASNYEESRAAFYQDTIIPEYLTPIAEGLSRAVCPEGVRIRFDIDTIPALLRSRISAASDLEAISFLTVDEKRELMGFAPMEKESVDG